MFTSALVHKGLVGLSPKHPKMSNTVGTQRLPSALPLTPLKWCELLCKLDLVADPLCLAYTREGPMNVCHMILSHLAVDPTKFSLTRIYEHTDKTTTGMLKYLVQHFFPEMVLAIANREGRALEVCTASAANGPCARLVVVDKDTASKKVANWKDGGGLIVLDEFGQGAAYLYCDARLAGTRYTLDAPSLHFLLHDDVPMDAECQTDVCEQHQQQQQQVETPIAPSNPTLEKGDLSRCSPGSQLLLEALYLRMRAMS